MKTKDSSTYVCMATIARKYIVASVTIVRINTENFSELLMRYVYQTMARNADNSRGSRSVIPAFHVNDRNECNYVPNAVPIEFGINISWRSMLTSHKLKGSIGTRGRAVIFGGLIKAVTKGEAILVNIRAPRYTASVLFLKVIAYTLG